MLIAGFLPVSLAFYKSNFELDTFRISQNRRKVRIVQVRTRKEKYDSL